MDSGTVGITDLTQELPLVFWSMSIAMPRYRLSGAALPMWVQDSDGVWWHRHLIAHSVH